MNLALIRLIPVATSQSMLFAGCCQGLSGTFVPAIISVPIRTTRRFSRVLIFPRVDVCLEQIRN
jgi:hypothetical protein